MDPFDAVTVTFPVVEIAPYADADPSTTFPFDDVTVMLSPELEYRVERIVMVPPPRISTGSVNVALVTVTAPESVRPRVISVKPFVKRLISVSSRAKAPPTAPIETVVLAS